MADPQSPYDSSLTPEQAQAADTYHQAGYSDAGIAGIIAGQGYESAGHGNINPAAVNPSSGALGVAQDLGSRKAGLVQEAAAEGKPPTDLGVQERYANNEMLGNADGGTEAPVGQYLQGADDPAKAGAAYIHNFERPGAAAEQTEDPAVAGAAQKLFPAVQARYAQEKQQLAASSDLLDKAMGPTGGGKFDHMPLPPTQRSPQGDPMADGSAALDNAMAQSAKTPPPKDPETNLTPGYDWGSMGSALKELPRGVLRGMANQLGLPADLGNWLSHYYAQHPRDAALVGSGGMDTGQFDNLPAYDPNSQGYRLPLGSSDIQSMIRYATGINPQMQDTSAGGETLGHMGEFIGAGLSPGGLVGDAGKAAAAAAGASRTKSLLGMLFHHVLAPVGISGGLDAGEWAVDKATGDQGTGEAVGIGARAALGGLALGALGKGAAAAKELTANAPQKYLNDVFEAAHGENAPFEKAAASANLAGGTGAGQPAGYEVPAMLRTGSAPLQQLFFNLRNADDRMHNDYAGPGASSMASRNMAALEGMRPEGDAQDAVTAVRNAQATRQSMLDQRVLQAHEAATQAGEIAARSSSGQQLVPGGAVGQQSGFDLGQELVGQLRAARDDAFAHADDQWDVARQQGFTTTPIGPHAGEMYAGLEGLMGDNIRLQQGANFPWEQVNDLYQDGRPRGMFDKLGVRQPETIGQNQLFDQGTTLEQLKGIDSRLGNAMRMEQDAISAPGNRGNPTLLRNLGQVRGIVWKALDDGAVDGGNQVALRSAMDATAQAHQTFGNGLLARVLNEQGGATNAPKILSQYLGNSQNAVQAADMFKNAMAQRTGAAAARLNLSPGGVPAQGAAPQQQFTQAFADWLRQDYLNTRTDLGGGAGTKWLTQRAGFFGRMTGNPDFDNLHSELMGYSQAADADLPRVQQEVAATAKANKALPEYKAAQLFLGGDAGPRLDAVFKSPSPGAAMQGIINDTLQHGSGQAFRGLQGMLFNRVMDEAMVNDPIRPNQTYYSGKVAQNFLDENKTAFDTMRKADPQWSAGLDRAVRTMAMEDRGRLQTGLRLPPPTIGGVKKGGWSAAGSLATKTTQYAFAHLIGRNLPAAGLQGEALSSQFGKEMAQHMPGQISSAINKLDPQTAVRQALQEAMFDPEKLRGLLAPVDKPNGAKWAGGVEPWLKATGVELPQGWLNPQGQQPQQGGQPAGGQAPFPQADEDPELTALQQRGQANIAAGYAKPGPYTTKLSPGDETKFEQWVKANHVPYDMSWPPDQSQQDYDMRGFWKAQQSGDPQAREAQQKDAKGQGMHFPDTWKTPYHESFSNQSMYATKNAPHWQGPQLLDHAGHVLFDARQHR